MIAASTNKIMFCFLKKYIIKEISLSLEENTDVAEDEEKQSDSQYISIVIYFNSFTVIYRQFLKTFIEKDCVVYIRPRACHMPNLLILQSSNSKLPSKNVRLTNFLEYLVCIFRLITLLLLL